MDKFIIENKYLNEGRMKTLATVAEYLQSKGINPKDICIELVNASKYMRELRENLI